MKVVIFAGGYGTRISEESSIRPKPMVEIGERPILWHIMKLYAHYLKLFNPQMKKVPKVGFEKGKLMQLWEEVY